MMNKKLILIGFLAFLTLPGFTIEKSTVTVTSTATSPDLFQPKDERNAQDVLPKAKDALWDTLYKTKIKVDDKAGTYSATFPDEVRKLNGQTIKISGFMLPLESTEKFSHFLLSKRTPTCPFCPPGAPNEIIEVYAAKPTEWIDDLVTYEGTFELMENKEMGVFFKLSNASKK